MATVCFYLYYGFDVVLSSQIGYLILVQKWLGG